MPIDVPTIGSDFLPNDQGRGYYGRLFEDDELEAPTFGWSDERASFVQTFNAKDSEYKAFILSTRAESLGLNLQTADTVIM
jgi:hypothetical protein